MEVWSLSLPLPFHNEQYIPPKSHRQRPGASPAHRNATHSSNFCVFSLRWIQSSVLSLLQSHCPKRHLSYIPIPPTGTIHPASASILHIDYPGRFYCFTSLPKWPCP